MYRVDAFVVIAFGQLMKISDSVTGLGITGGELFRALAYSLPPMLGILIPVSMLLPRFLRSVVWQRTRKWLRGVPVVARHSPFIPYLLLGLYLDDGLHGRDNFGRTWGVQGLRDLMSRSAQRALAEGTKPGQFTSGFPVWFFTLSKVIKGA